MKARRFLRQMILLNHLIRVIFVIQRDCPKWMVKMIEIALIFGKKNRRKVLPCGASSKHSTESRISSLLTFPLKTTIVSPLRTAQLPDLFSNMDGKSVILPDLQSYMITLFSTTDWSLQPPKMTWSLQRNVAIALRPRGTDGLLKIFFIFSSKSKTSDKA